MRDKMNTYSGLQFNPMEIEEKDILIEDIGHALSLICRGGGHLKYFYSVGQHSINCAKEAEARGWTKRVILACLLHDASEAYISDIIRPVKRYLTNYLEIEERIMDMIFRKFGLGDLSEEEKAQVKQIDDQMLESELSELIAGGERIEAPRLHAAPDLGLRNFTDVENEFIAMTNEYIGEHNLKY